MALHKVKRGLVVRGRCQVEGAIITVEVYLCGCESGVTCHRHAVGEIHVDFIDLAELCIELRYSHVRGEFVVLDIGRRKILVCKQRNLLDDEIRPAVGILVTYLTA